MMVMGLSWQMRREREREREIERKRERKRNFAGDSGRWIERR